MAEAGIVALPPRAEIPIANDSCAEVNWFSFFFFRWLNPLVTKGRQEQISLKDTPRLAPLEDTMSTTHQLLDHLEQAEIAGYPHPLLYAIVRTFWLPLLCYEGLQVSGHFLRLLNPLLLQQVLIFQETQSLENGGDGPSGFQVRNGLQAVFLFIALGLFLIIWDSQVNFFRNRISVRITGALRGAVMHRCIQGTVPRRGAEPGGGSGSRAQASSAPAVYNVISFDVDPQVQIIWVILGVWLFPVQLASTLLVLFQSVHWAIVPGLCVVIVAKFIVGVMLVFDGLYRHHLLAAKDLRLSKCNEGFSNVRTLQMLSWIDPFRAGIMDARNREIHAQRVRLWMTKMPSALDYSLGVIVNLATFAYFIQVEQGQMKASTALPVIHLVSTLIGPFGQIPQWVNDYLVWRSAYDRLGDFLGLILWPSSSTTAQGPGIFPDQPPEASKEASASGSDDGVVAAYKDCSLSWGCSSESQAGKAGKASKDADADVEEGLETAEGEPLLDKEAGPTLQSLSLSVERGKLLVVVAQEGQGKTSFLKGLLGEMAVEAGSVTSPAVTRRAKETAHGARGQRLPDNMIAARNMLAAHLEGSEPSGVEQLAVPYAAQEVMLMTGTVRWNILFGAPFDAAVYQRVLRACALESDILDMPKGDFTEIAQGGATLSGGQKARVGLARSVYKAAFACKTRPQETPLVLLDDVVCALDRRVAAHVCQSLFNASDGLLSSCAAIIATADPWWLFNVDAAASSVNVILLRGGQVVASGAPSELRGQAYPELEACMLPQSATTMMGMLFDDIAPGDPAGNPPEKEENAEDETHKQLHSDSQDQKIPSANTEALKDFGSKPMLELATKAPKIDETKLLEEEHREKGQVGWKTYKNYFQSIGWWTLLLLAIVLSGIMLFQNLANLWIVYWTSSNKEKTTMNHWISFFHFTPPTHSSQMLLVYGVFCILFTVCNFVGHGIEIVGGIGAARKIFADALKGTLSKPFRWWDSNPTGRVLNRFSTDVDVMDRAITNIMGVIFGAVLFFISHFLVLAIATPLSLCLLPVIIVVLEYFARFYRRTIREVQRILLVCTSTVYQEMAEAVIGQMTVRAYAAGDRVFLSSMDGLDNMQRMQFAKDSVLSWIGMRMDLIGYIFTTFNQLYPVFQYFHLFAPQSAALVGFSITYSQDVLGIMRQLILNYSDLEMQLISIERLREYAQESERVPSGTTMGRPNDAEAGPLRGLQLHDVSVTYREGGRPALSGVSLFFPHSEACAITGRTGSGKSSLLLSVLQLVPYTGQITVAGHILGQMDPEDVRQRLVGVVPQQPALFAGSLRWNLDPKGLKTDEDIWDALQAVGLKGLCRSHGQGLKATIATESGTGVAGSLALSQGQRQMLCAARVLLRRPRVAMLDEVTASLPPEVAVGTVKTLLKRFMDQGAAVLLVTHQQELLPLCDRVITVSSGRIVNDRRILRDAP